MTTIETLAREIAAMRSPTWAKLARLRKAIKDVDGVEDAGRYRAVALRKYVVGSSDIEIDDGAMVSKGDDGAFVAAWVWVAESELGG